MWHKRSKVIIILNQYIYHLFLNLVQCTQPQSRGRLLTSQLSRWWWSTPSVRRVSHRRLLNKPAVLYRSIESRLEGKSVIGKGAHSTGITAALGGLSSKVHSRTCESFRSGPRLESVHQEPPYTDTFRKGAATVAQLQWTISEDLFFWAFCFFLSQIRWAERERNDMLQRPAMRQAARGIFNPCDNHHLTTASTQRSHFTRRSRGCFRISCRKWYSKWSRRSWRTVLTTMLSSRWGFPYQSSK